MRESCKSIPGRRVGLAAALAGAVLLVGACASTPLPPTASLNAASTAIANAEKANAGNYAGAELGEARQKLALAKTAVSNEKMIDAERLANEAKVGAELAAARTAAAKAAAVNKDMQRGADVLVEEMKRSGDQQ